MVRQPANLESYFALETASMFRKKTLTLESLAKVKVNSHPLGRRHHQPLSQKMLAAKFRVGMGNTSIIPNSALTMTSNKEKKEAFYEHLKAV